eukprot:TRINITY_DN594_c0_g1_i2.p1 TRINITY_DN594_c0_g1~~TRINITY_DN594_c0_g1_i2.p1  ORF type:complete len:316 (-),score=26.35 TRINITY_DN594_c0_g1_i2:161-1108(-)
MSTLNGSLSEASASTPNTPTKLLTRDFLLHFAKTPNNPTLASRLSNLVLTPPPVYYTPQKVTQPTTQITPRLAKTSPRPKAQGQWLPRPKPTGQESLELHDSTPTKLSKSRLPLSHVRAVKSQKSITPSDIPGPAEVSSSPREKENLCNRPKPVLISKTPQPMKGKGSTQNAMAWTPKSKSRKAGESVPVTPISTPMRSASKTVKATETDPRRLQQRQKQINYGYSTEGYSNYVAQYPKEKRSKGMPKTPDKLQRCSKRCWDAQIRRWRRQLHLWDPNPSAPLPDDVSSSDEAGEEDFDAEEEEANMRAVRALRF